MSGTKSTSQTCYKMSLNPPRNCSTINSHIFLWPSARSAMRESKAREGKGTKLDLHGIDLFGLWLGKENFALRFYIYIRCRTTQLTLRCRKLVSWQQDWKSESPWLFVQFKAFLKETVFTKKSISEKGYQNRKAIWTRSRKAWKVVRKWDNHGSKSC